MRLNENVYFVKGFKNAAIYDLNEKKIYVVNEIAKKILEKYIENENSVFDEYGMEYIQKLKQLKLLTSKNDFNYNRTLKEKPKSKLSYAWLEITDRCNLNCIHCYGEFGKPSTKNEELLTTSEWKKIIDKLIELKCKDIQFIGGEPIVYNDFFELVEYAHAKGMDRVDIFTNATLIDENNILLLKKANCNIRVSVYGHNSEIHDKITQHKGSFEKTKNALLLLSKYKIPTKIAVVIMRENEDYIKNIKKFIISTGHKYSGYDVIRPSCVNTISTHTILNTETLKSRYNMEPVFWTSKESFKENFFYNSCWNGKIAITATGDIIPCIFARDEVVGNIRKNSFEQIEKKIINKWSITKDDIEVCKDCEFRYCCHDCRPIAKGINGDTYSKYPRCCYDPYTGLWENIEDITKEIK